MKKKIGIAENKIQSSCKETQIRIGVSSQLDKMIRIPEYSIKKMSILHFANLEFSKGKSKENGQEEKRYVSLEFKQIDSSLAYLWKFLMSKDPTYL